MNITRVSVGAACLPDHAETAESVVLNADNALYAAKAAGRNRSVVCAPAGAPAAGPAPALASAAAR